MRWRRGDEVGLAFPEAAAAPLASPQPQFGDLAQRVAELEAEMAGRWRTLKQLKRERPGGDVDVA